MKYSPTNAIHLSEQVVHHGKSVYEVCRNNPTLDEKELRVWCALYREYGTAVFSQSQEFDVTLQNKIIMDKLESGLSLRQTCVKYQITSRSRLRNWIKSYKSGIMNEKKRRKNRISEDPENEISPSERIKQLEQELRFARAENAYLKKLQALMRETRKNV